MNTNQYHFPWAVIVAVLIVVSGCSHKPSATVSSSKYNIQKDDLNTRWIDLTANGCHIRVLALGANHLRLSHTSPRPKTGTVCEVGTSPLIDQIAPAARTLIHSYSGGAPPQLMIEHSLLLNPSLIKKWAAFLKNSQDWRMRSTTLNEKQLYALIKKLLNDGDIFSSYEPLLAVFRGSYKKEDLIIEKVSYTTATSYAFYETDLKPLGYTSKDVLPIPLIINKILEK